MHIQTHYNGNRVDSNVCRVIKSRNELQLNSIEYQNGQNRDQRVLILESHLPLEQDVNVFIKGDTLIIEASRSVEFDKPFRSHLLEKDRLSEIEMGGLEIGFSELKLNHDFKYHIVSYQVMNPRLIKVVLSIQKITDIN
jgi:hypothetical protein